MSKLIFDLLSDTHNQHSKFTCAGGDFLLHAGDISGRGTHEEIWNFILWLEIQPYKHKVIIPGNHDWTLENNFAFWKDLCDKKGIHLLNDSGVELDGVKIWGSPITPWFHSWAYNRRRTQEEHDKFGGGWIKPHWDLIPTDTEVLITHGPPLGVLDEVMRYGRDAEYHPEYVGCKELMEKIKTTQIKLHVFGHIHEGRGYEYQKNITYINASSLSDMYRVVDPKPIRTSRETFQDGSVGYVV